MDSVQASWAALQPTNPSQAVLASPALWDALVDLADSPSSPSDNPPSQLTLALEPRYGAAKGAKGLRTLVVQARQAGKADLGQLEDPPDHVVLVPAHLSAAHPSVFGGRRLTATSPPSLLISLSAAVPLSSVILLSSDHSSHDYASTNQAELETQLAGEKADLVREGDSVRLEGGQKRWKVAMAEPVLQGKVFKGFTRLLVLPPSGEDAEDDSASVSEAEAPQANGDNSSETEEDDSFDFDLEIDESFLASSVLAPRRHGTSAYPTPLTSPLPPHPSANNALALGGLTNGTSFPLNDPPTSKRAAKAPSGALVVPLPLAHPVPSELLVPLPDEDEDDVQRAFASTADLGRLGLFSGDWVVLQPAAVEAVPEESEREEERREGRLVRVFAADALVEGISESTSPSPTLHLPPPLVLNLLGPASFASSPSPSPSLLLNPSPSVSPTLPSPHPTASSLTLARLASPHSVNKLYQPLFLEGLKEYFSAKRRAVKRGDVIAVGIEEDRVRFFAEGKEGAEEDVALPASSSKPSAVVHFLITSLTVDPPSPRLSATDSSATELDFAIEQGKLGGVVDPKVTKLLQTGVERGRVPDAAGWLGIPSLPISLAPTILGDPTPASRLYEFLTSALEPRARQYGLPGTVLLKGAKGSGKRTLVKGVAGRAGVGVLELDCFDLLGDTDLKTEGRIRALAVDKALACAPCVLLLRNIEALARKSQAMETGQEPPMTTVLRECLDTIREGWQSSGFPVVVVATTTDVEKVPTGVLGLFKEEIGIEAPAEPERLAILRSLTTQDLLAPDVSLRSLAVQTAALVANDLVDLVRRARAAAAERVLELTSASSASSASSPTSFSSPTLAHLSHAGVSLTSLDFASALEKARSAYSESIGAPKIPNVTWDDVGGLANVKSDILDTIQLPLERPELFADGLKKRSGILLYGPPGTGKTLLAKAVATSCSLNFFSVKGPELLNMYIGESEANVRRVFQRARDAKPCVIFFDELDSVAPKRGNQGDSGGVMDRIVSQLLAELDGMSEGKGGNDVFVIGATNRPDLLDPALLRPGRFDRMLYLGVSDTHSAQLKILQALTRKFKLAPDTDLAKVAETCPFNYTGADFYALCSDAMLKAMTRKAWEVDARIAELNAQPPYSTGAAPLLTPQYYLAEMAAPAEIEVLVAQQDFQAALAELVPSVSKAEMLHYATVQQRFSAETMNSAEKLAEKEQAASSSPSSDPSLPAAASSTASSTTPVPNGSLVVGAEEKERPKANGLVVDGFAGDETSDDEEEKERRRRAKGKGKARAD
ncbi:hypothetical protein JCM6882_008631 [Rhodosporidiobolus microsporus]